MNRCTQSFDTLKAKSGLPPGALIHVGRKKESETKFRAIQYQSEVFNETVCTNAQECIHLKDLDFHLWLNVDGLHDVEQVRVLGEAFGLHPLLLEDVLNTYTRPKFEEFNEIAFVSFKMLGIDPSTREVISEQVSMVHGQKWLISFQEKEGDLFDGFRQRLKENKSSVRRKDTSYLLYRLMDIVVDNYFLVLEHISDRSEELEDEAILNSDMSVVQKVHALKKELNIVRKAVAPLHEVVLKMYKDEGGFEDSLKHHIHDMLEHIKQIQEGIEVHNDNLSGIVDLNLSGLSNNMNRVMQTLTIVAAIFIPLSFLSSLYGMNFKYIPELTIYYGYFGILAIMLTIVIFMLRYFKKNKWL